MNIKEKLFAKIESLEASEQLLQEVYDFIRFLEHKEEQMTYSKLSEKSFDAIWANDEDAAYDRYLPKILTF